MRMDLSVVEESFKKSGGKLVGDVLFVEHVPDIEEKTSGGIYVSPSSEKQLGSFTADRPHFVRVLAVGEGYYNDETGEDVPLEYKPGNILLLPMNSVKYYSSFGSYIGKPFKYNAMTPLGMGIAKAGEEWIKFDGQENFEVFMSYYSAAWKEVVKESRGE